jgi:hypothetical protein
MEGLGAMILGFPIRDSRGRAALIVCRDTGAYSPDLRLLHVLLPVARLMKAGFEFFFRLPSDAFNDGFDGYVNGGYAGYRDIKGPDGHDNTVQPRRPGSKLCESEIKLER